MGISGFNSIHGPGKSRPGSNVNSQDLEMAKKLVAAGLISSVQDFFKLSDSEKQALILEYNKSNTDSSGERNNGSNGKQGTVLGKFLGDVNLNNIKLE